MQDNDVGIQLWAYHWLLVGIKESSNWVNNLKVDDVLSWCSGRTIAWLSLAANLSKHDAQVLCNYLSIELPDNLSDHLPLVFLHFFFPYSYCLGSEFNAQGLIHPLYHLLPQIHIPISCHKFTFICMCESLILMLASAEKLNEANEELTKFSAAVLTIYVQSFVECLQACRDVGSFIGTVSKHASGGPLNVVKLLC